MVGFLIYLKRRFESLWGLVEKINAVLLGIFYPKITRCNSTALNEIPSTEFDFSMVRTEDIDALIELRKRQTNDYLKYFDPHRFDEQTLRKMIGNKAYILMKVTPKKQKEVVGYFFLRCFFIGTAFHGLIVDERYTNRGMGTLMWKISNEICTAHRFKMYATVSKNNLPSLVSAGKATDVTVKKNLPNDFLLIECKRKKK